MPWRYLEQGGGDWPGKPKKQYKISKYHGKPGNVGEICLIVSAFGKKSRKSCYARDKKYESSFSPV